MSNETPEQNRARWTKTASDLLLGKKIVAVRYLNDEEMQTLGWETRCVVIQLDDGNLIFPSCDDEGNGAGALFTNDQEVGCLPVLWQ